MAENTRVRVEPDIEQYLKSQSERVLGKPVNQLTAADLTTLANRIVYEHRLAQQMASQVPFTKLFSWLMNWVPSGGNKVVSLGQSSEAPALKASLSDNFEFDADLGDLFDKDEAA
ncbi:hypothetical protein H6F78_00100 [Coleofasciculus sp. FACHB-64]|nr:MULTISPECIES: hypothetical protein [unclassified Coleofasciculus]MBD1840858.1 hypothetical protein [Coleofasciculus sp. FACHB-501]MBD2044048.1 hypothetical protein [Coleofasciculus sp. FACHB-64]